MSTHIGMRAISFQYREYGIKEKPLAAQKARNPLGSKDHRVRYTVLIILSRFGLFVATYTPNTILKIMF